jgi:hypothetical protein
MEKLTVSFALPTPISLLAQLSEENKNAPTAQKKYVRFFLFT